MKDCFERTFRDIPTADWAYLADFGVHDRAVMSLDDADCYRNAIHWDNDGAIVAKHIFGSRGRGNTLHENVDSFLQWTIGKNPSNYIVERYYPYSREYRLHVTADGCFYSCRKMLRADVPVRNRWFRNDSNCVWVREENPDFDRPVNWDAIEAACVNALTAVGLDVGACDVRVQSATKRNGDVRTDPAFIVVEINSAPSFGDVTAVKYLEQIPNILVRKASEVFDNV
jgi:glutathione synthase/RimK-type ligase-like ATP-grasp enzyme